MFVMHFASMKMNADVRTRTIRAVDTPVFRLGSSYGSHVREPAANFEGGY
jgi:hypothetical protein